MSKTKNNVSKQNIFLPGLIIYWTTRLYGVYPFTIIGHISEGNIQSKFLDKTIGCLNLCIQLFIIWVNTEYDLQGSCF